MGIYGYKYDLFLNEYLSKSFLIFNLGISY